MEQVQPLLHVVQLAGVKVQTAAGIPHQFRHIVGGVAQLGHLLGQLGQLGAVSSPLGQGVFGAGEQGHRPVGHLAPGEGLPRLVHRIGDALGVAENFPLGGELRLLAHPQLGPLQLSNLVLEGIHTPGLLPLVHLHRFELAAQVLHMLIGRSVILALGSQVGEVVQALQVGLLV